MVDKVKSQNKDGYAVKVICRLQKRSTDAKKTREMDKEQSLWNLSQKNDLKKERTERGFKEM
jgi:hypothetical protein